MNPKITTGILTIALLIVANIFMTVAWYGHLRLKDYDWFAALPLVVVILMSWFIALFEYFLQVPANRIGFTGNGGPFSLLELKVIQEVITLTVFVVFSMIAFKTKLAWNHIACFLCLIMAVFFAFKK